MPRELVNVCFREMTMEIRWRTCGAKLPFVSRASASQLWAGSGRSALAVRETDSGPSASKVRCRDSDPKATFVTSGRNVCKAINSPLV